MKSGLLLYLSLGLPILPMPAGVAAQAQGPKPASYTMTDLGTLPGGSFSQATLNSNNGLITGLSTVADGSQHAVVWAGGQIMDISSRGLGGPNSYALGITPGGIAAGTAESSGSDPYNENFCLFSTGVECLPITWQSGTGMTSLPLPGGNNGQAGPVNNRGQIVGIAETGTVDRDCPGTVAANGTGPQVLDFVPVVWDPGASQPRVLKLPGADTVGAALWINNNGQVVGTTGTCRNSYPPPICAGPHAVLWDRDGSVHDLGSLGGTANPAVEGVGNMAFAINDRDQIAGASALPGNQTVHAFLWSPRTGMQDLGTLQGDVWSAGLAINDTGEVVGASIDGPVATGNSRAVIWHNGQPTDLNAVVPAGTTLYALVAFGINNAGQIVGFGLDLNTFEIHGFIATPIAGNGGPAARGATNRISLPEEARKSLLRRLR
jgi:probable HAF family extracellular repeat protein